MKWAALLKGVNVGGNRKLPMAALRTFLTGLGLTEVETLLASGNAVFAGEPPDERALAEAARQALGLDTEWFLRSHAELAAVVAGNPFPEAAAARPQHLLVSFHREPFPAGLLGELRHDGPEKLTAIGRELFIDFPDGIGRSTLHPAMARARFLQVATGRNWNTVTKLAAMTA